MAPAELVKRGRGRPAIGPATTIRLSAEHVEMARRLGDGDQSAGIRRALEIADATVRRQEARAARAATVASPDA